MRNPEQKALTVLADALPAGVEIVQDERTDVAGVTINVPGHTPILVDLAWAGAGFPRDIERALTKISGNRKALVITAEAMSEGAQRILGEQGIAWASADGAANLVLGTIWVVKDPKRSPRPRGRGAVNWTNSLATIAETVLNRARLRDDTYDGILVPSVGQLSSESYRSAGSVSNALTTFDREGWTQKVGSRRGRSAIRQLVAPGPMLDAWAAHEAVVHEQFAEYHSLTRDPIQLGLAIASEFEAAVFSGRFAADRLAPFSTEIGVIRCYLPDEMTLRAREDRLRRIGLTLAPGAGRLKVLWAGPHIVQQSRTVDGFRLASPVRTYADLLRESSRGEEAAAHLRETAIGF